MVEQDPTTVTPHAELPGIFNVEGWSFDYDEEHDLEYIDQAIRAWNAWRAFVVNQGQAPF